MPHQCTNCRLTFDDGSKQMLGGCPECGGNKFQFLPKDAAVDGEPTHQRARDGDVVHERPGAAPGVDVPNRQSAASDAATTAADTSDSDIIEAPPEPIEAMPDVEDRAQASARRAVVTEDELPTSDERYTAEEPAAPAPEPDRPDLTQLREELNEQFESIKILRPGEYELNLMELYDRQEYIIALEEDGRYVIDVPDTWRDDD